MSSLSIPFPFSSLSLLASALQTLGGQGLSLNSSLLFVCVTNQLLLLLLLYYTR